MKKLVSPLLAVAIAVLSSCATSIPVQVRKPAEVNMADAKEIAVLDFDYPRELRSSNIFDMLYYQLSGQANIKRNTPEERVAFYLTDQLVRALNGTEYFTIYDTRGLAKSLSGTLDAASLDPVAIGKKAGVQAIVLGEITDMSRSTDYRTDKIDVKDPKTGIVRAVYKNYIITTDKVSVSYRVLSTETGKILATKTFSNQSKQEIEDNDSNKPVGHEDKCRDMVMGFVPQITRQLAPYTVVERRILLGDKMKDPAMKDADELVKEGAYGKALDAYLKIWARSFNPAAGVNAAIMYEVTGQLDDAVDFLEKTVLKKIPSEKAAKELERLKRAQADAARLEEQTK